MAERVRPYLFYDVAVSICSTCYRKVEAKIVFQDGSVYMLKRCPEHGSERVLMADDVDYYRRCREVFIKPPEMPLRFNTPVRWGCPYDCGLCPDHEQHSCLSLVEITDHCNLQLPDLLRRQRADAAAVPQRSSRSSGMLDASCATRASPTSCRSPAASRRSTRSSSRSSTRAKAAPIRHLMVNTNGVRDRDTTRRSPSGSPTYMPGFEVYLQFDSFERERAARAARRRSARRARDARSSG